MTKRRRHLMVLTGAIPAIAIAGGLAGLPPESVTRQQYWPWFPLLVLALGLGFSGFFWIVLAGRSDRRDSNKPE